MQRTTSRNSWLFKAFFMGVYLVFFVVQIHLRYAISSFQEAGAWIASVGKHSDKKAISFFNKTTPGKESKPVAKLNKRYFPTHVEFLAIQYDFRQEFTVIHTQTLGLTPVLFSPLSLCPLLRGPPANC